MNIGIFLGHPAHFHMLKNAATNLQNDGHNIFFVIKKKDILEQLLINAGLSFTSIREGRGNGKMGMVKSVLTMEYHMCRFIKKNKINLLIGSTLSFSSRVLMGIPVIVMGEDDASVVPIYANLVYPWASAILTPVSCNNGSFDSKSTKYQSYHELAYLHPNHFTPDKTIVSKYFNPDKPYFLLRFAKLNAHHDAGIHGITSSITYQLIELLTPYGDIYITSERELEPQFELYRIKINPLDMHHVMAFAQLYIGDSQTMAAEAGVLGTPFIRFNDFVGRIGYLKELEDTYNLGYGIRANEENRLYKTIENLLNTPNRKEVFQQRRQKMLSDKIDYAKFLTWFIENYPESKTTMKQNPNYQFRFK